VKCNIDGASRGCPNISTLGGIFRDLGGKHFRGFSEKLGISNVFRAEVKGVVRAI
jgi:ribonuclease HI